MLEIIKNIIIVILSSISFFVLLLFFAETFYHIGCFFVEKIDEWFLQK